MHSKLTAGLRVAGVCALLLGVWPDAGRAETLTLTRDQAIGTARQAFLSGDVALTFAIASKIAAANPMDVEALLLLSASNEALGKPGLAYAQGRQAWAAASVVGRPDGLRYDIAAQTAHAAWAAGQKRGAARWLGRAVKLAPDAQTRARDEASLQFVISQTALTFSGNLRITPTDNLNNGASSGRWTVADLYIGNLGGWSVAHAGIRTTADVTASYNLGVARSGRSRNSLSFALSTTQHSLTAAEAAANPGLNPRELDSWRAGLSWSQDRLLNGRPPLRMTVEASQTWFGGIPYSPALRGEVRVPLTATGDLTLEAGLERQWTETPVTSSSLRLDGHRAVAMPWGAGTLIYGVGATFLRSASINSTFDSVDGSVILDPGLGGDTVSTHVGVGANWRHYDRYAIGIGSIEATDGRTDTGLWLRAGLGFETAKLAGMTPTLTVQRQMTKSDISKYQTASTSLYLGLAADF